MSSESATAVRLVEVASSVHNRRFRVDLRDGAAVECVLYRGDTLCVSSQVGCAVGCPFCASGENGLLRPLTFDELWGQLEAARVQAPVRKVTLSGVGEPLHNARAAGAFVERAHAEGVGVTLTTSGGPLARLTEAIGWPHRGLTVSVHAGSEATRARLVPRGPRLDALFSALRGAWPSLSGGRRKRIALAYLALEGVNDSDAELDAFAEQALSLPGARVHLYAHNAVTHSALRGVPRARYLQMGARLRERGLYVQLSSQARLEDNGGCGTLVMLQNARVRPAATR